MWRRRPRRRIRGVEPRLLVHAADASTTITTGALNADGGRGRDARPDRCETLEALHELVPSRLLRELADLVE
jgi:hypothetical protein